MRNKNLDISLFSFFLNKLDTTYQSSTIRKLKKKI